MSLDAANVVSLDMGLPALVTDSRGGKVANPCFVQRAATNLRRKQKALPRWQRGSARRAKARQRVARAHERLANARRDFQYPLSRQIVDHNQAVSIETLTIHGMLRNRRLARHIGNAAWHGLIEKITYKAVADQATGQTHPLVPQVENLLGLRA